MTTTCRQMYKHMGMQTNTREKQLDEKHS